MNPEDDFVLAEKTEFISIHDLVTNDGSREKVTRSGREIILHVVPLEGVIVH